MQKNNQERLRAVIYARYSSHRQTEQSIEGQLRDCHAYAERNGYVVVSEYIDRIKSAKTDHRPNFQRMIKDSEKRLFDVIIVWKLDRFARNRYDSANYKAKLKKYDVRVFSAMETITQNAEGILMESLLEGMAEYYSAELAEKVKRGMRETALKCQVYGVVPYGFKTENKHFVVDEERAAVVRYVFNSYANEVVTITDILQDLKNKGIKNTQNRDFTFNSIRGMLSNVRYTGVYKYADIEIPGGVPRIIDDKTFDTVQRRLKINRSKGAMFKARTSYILTPKLYCGYCNGTMTGDSSTGKSGTMYFYYSCKNRKFKTTDCTKKRISKDYIEDLVINNILDNVLVNDVIEKIAENIVELQEKQGNSDLLIYLQEQLSETEASIENIIRAIEQGVVTNRTSARLKELEEQAEALKFEIDTEKCNSRRITKDEIIYLLEMLREGNPNDINYRKRLVDAFIHRIYVYDDELVITYNYSNNDKDNRKTVSEKFSDTVLAGEPSKYITENIFLYGLVLVQRYKL